MQISPKKECVANNEIRYLYCNRVYAVYAYAIDTTGQLFDKIKLRRQIRFRVVPSVVNRDAARRH